MSEERTTWTDLRQKTDHADTAFRDLSASFGPSDLSERTVLLRSAQVNATLALHDKVEELSATLKVCVSDLIESNSELSATMKKAANAIHADVRRATVKPARREGEAA